MLLQSSLILPQCWMQCYYSPDIDKTWVGVFWLPGTASPLLTTPNPSPFPFLRNVEFHINVTVNATPTPLNSGYAPPSPNPTPTHPLNSGYAPAWIGQYLLARGVSFHYQKAEPDPLICCWLVLMADGHLNSSEGIISAILSARCHQCCRGHKNISHRFW